MKAELYWIAAPTPGRLAVMPRPRGGDWLEDEVQAWRSEGVDQVVSLLTPNEISEMDLEQEVALARAHGIEFQAFPITDRGVPSSQAAFQNLVAALADDLAAGRNIAIHCRQGLGRAPLVAIGILIATGLDLDNAIAAIGHARGVPVPETAEQKRWLAEFAKGLSVVTRK